MTDFNLFSKLKNGDHLIVESKIDGMDVDYWHSTVVNSQGSPISGGFADCREDARKIAVAEFLERESFRKLKEQGGGERSKWHLDEFPTACGFAVGFSRRNTLLRSLAEACERWVMSLWIEDQFALDESDSEKVWRDLDEPSRYFASQFDRVRYFLKKVQVEFDGEKLSIPVAQTLAFSEKGVFPGSSAQLTGNLWQHALLESYRHLFGLRNNPPDQGFPTDRIRYFAEHSEPAERIVDRATKHDWPDPKIMLSHCEPFDGGRYFVARSILDGWRSWHMGPVDRFLY